MRTITLNPKQQRSVDILTRLEAGALDVGQQGFGAVIHGNTGRGLANRTDPATLERILALAGPEGEYHDLNVCHLRDLLEQQERIKIGRSTLDRLLKQAGLCQVGKAPVPVHRRKRLRRPAEGMLLQIDGSPFD